jgi:hypothetical protein
VPLNHYRFSSEWHLDHPASVVWDALEALVDYPRWWPQIRRAELVELAACELTVRSFLPYDLRFVSRPARREDGVLEVTLSGDLEGWSRWTITGATTALFEEEVEVTKPLLRRLAVARPAFQLNHAWMMHSGERGLRKHLAG